MVLHYSRFIHVSEDTSIPEISESGSLKHWDMSLRNLEGVGEVALSKRIRWCVNDSFDAGALSALTEGCAVNFWGCILLSKSTRPSDRNPGRRKSWSSTFQHLRKSSLPEKTVSFAEHSSLGWFAPIPSVSPKAYETKCWIVMLVAIISLA